MKGGCLHRLLVHKLCFGLVVLLAVPVVVLLLEGAPVLTIFSTTPGQLKVLSQGFLQQQEQEHLGDDGATLAGSPGPSSRSRLHKSKGKVMNSNFLCMLSHNILIVFVVCPTFASCLLTYPKPLKAYFSWCFFVNQTICGCSMFTH